MKYLILIIALFFAGPVWAQQPTNTAQLGGAAIQNASNGLNTTGTGLGTTALTGQCDDTSPQALTENSFGHLRVDCTTHALKVDLLTKLDAANDSVTVKGGNANAIVSATANAKLNMTTATTTEIVALSGSTVIYVTKVKLLASAATNVKLVRGTGTNCGTGTTDVSSLWHLTPAVASTTIGFVEGTGLGAIYFGAAGGALCVNSSAAVNVDVDISYAQY